jgi:hypothetical protein
MVALAAATGGAIYGLWRKALLPALVVVHRSLSHVALKEQLTQVADSAEAIQSLGRNQNDFYSTLEKVQQSCERTEGKMDGVVIAVARMEQRWEEQDRQEKLHGRYQR